MKTEEVFLDDQHKIVPIEQATKIVTRTLDSEGEIISEKWEDIVAVMPTANIGWLIALVGIVILAISSLTFYLNLPTIVSLITLLVGLLISIYGTLKAGSKL